MAAWCGGCKGWREDQETDLIEITRVYEDLEGEISMGKAETVMRNWIGSGREAGSLDVLGLGVESLQEQVAQVKKLLGSPGGSIKGWAIQR